MVTDSKMGMSHRSGDNGLTIIPLLGLTRELASLLTPVEPSAAFKEELYDDLLVSARQHHVRQRILTHMTPASLDEESKGILARAAFAPASRSGRSSYSLRSLHFWQADRSGVRWMLGAAALGSAAVSLVGVVAYVVHHKSSADPASTPPEMP
jgi:hypothetical protein